MNISAQAPIEYCHCLDLIIVYGIFDSCIFLIFLGIKVFGFSRTKLENHWKIAQKMRIKSIEKFLSNRINQNENCCVFAIRREMWNVLKARVTRVWRWGVGLVCMCVCLYLCLCDCKIKTWKIRIGKKACVKHTGSVTFFLSLWFGLFAFFEFTFWSEFNPCIHSEQRWYATFSCNPFVRSFVRPLNRYFRSTNLLIQHLYVLSNALIHLSIHTYIYIHAQSISIHKWNHGAKRAPSVCASMKYTFTSTNIYYSRQNSVANRTQPNR